MTPRKFERGFVKATVFNQIEETLIALLFGLMTALTFANVVARYGFGSNILWSVELAVFLFAWMVLLGASYEVKKNAHLGVDMLINVLPPRVRRWLGLLSVAICLGFSFLMLKGSWDYWANFANLPATEGRWFPLGFESEFRGKGWYEVDDIPMPSVLAWIANIFNNGEEYEKIPRLLPYVVLPVSMALLFFRFAEAGWALWNGKIDRIVASHDTQESVNTMTN